MQSKGNQKDTVKSSARKSTVETAGPPARTINIQNFVDKKLQPVKRIEIPESVKFPNAENDANNWSISVVAKYVKEKLELPQYVESFKRHEVDGLKFIAMNESNFAAAEVTNKLHAMKLTSHAELLRELVLERAHIERPNSELDWSVAHLAAWLTYDKACPETAIFALKAKLNGYKLKDISGKKAVSSIGAADLSEAEMAAAAFDSLAQKIQKVCIEEDERKADQTKHAGTDEKVTLDEELNEVETAKLKKKKKAKTAIQKRREKEQQDGTATVSEEHTAAADDLEESESELKVVRNDSLPVKSKKTDSESAYGNVMSSIFAEVRPSPAAQVVADPTPLDVTNPNAYGKVRESVSHSDTDKAKDKKVPKEPKVPVPRSNQLDDATDHHNAELEQMEMQQGDVANPDLFHMEGYKKSKERKKFVNKIANLRKIVAEHAQTMQDLRDQAHILKRENLMIKEQQKLLLQEGGASQELIATLVQDRNAALAELEKVVSLYDEHTSRERDEVVRDLRALARDTFQAKSETDDMWRNRSQQISQLGDLTVKGGHSPVRRSNESRPETTHRQSKERHRRNNRNNSDSSGSDLDDDPRSSLPVAKSANNKTAPTALHPTASNPSVTAPPVTIVSAPVSAPATPLVPRVAVLVPPPASSTIAETPSSATFSIQNKASHPLTVARTLLASTTTPSHTGAPATPPSATAAPPTDLMRMVDQTADSTVALWQGILRTYKVPRNPRAEHFSDNKLLLRCISVPWQRLGHQMLQDAHSSKIDKDVRKALKGLEKCAKKAVLGATRAAKRSLESTQESNNTIVPSSPFKTQSPTKKKSTHSELGSTAFPVDSEFTATAGVGQSGAGGAAEEVNCHHRAAGVVFGLALVLRIMNRYSAEGADKTQLLYLLNKVNHGELPIAEISRDNMRDFLDSHIGIDLKWDKYDSVCHKLDPDRNGFISTPSVILAFSQLTPLSDRSFVSHLPSGNSNASANAGSTFNAEFGELLLLSVTTNTMAKPKQLISEAFMSLILHNSKSSASFAKFIQKEQERVSLEDKGYVPDTLSPRSAKISPDARVAEQQLFAADILYELSKEFVYKAEQMPDLESIKLSKSSKQDLQASQKKFLAQKKHISFLVQQHHETCSAVARGVQVYEGGSRKALVEHLSTFMLTFLSFRRRVVVNMIEQAHASRNNNTATSLGDSITGLNSTSSLHHHASSKLSVEQLQQVLLSIETNIATLTGLYSPQEEETFSPLKPKSKGPAGIKLAPDPLSLKDYDLIITELLGIPLPKYVSHTEGGCCTGMAQMQAQVETVMFTINEHFGLEERLMVVAPEPPKPLASSLALKDLQQTLFKELWAGETPSQEPDFEAQGEGDETHDPTHARRHSPSKSLRTVIEGPPIHVVEEINQLMHTQRVAQANQYLEILNEKAAKRKRMIRGLMNLWQAAKYSVSDNNKIGKFDSAAEIEQKRLLMMPATDILAQTKAIQTQLVSDMQEKSTTKMSQLSQRINLLRQGIVSQSIPDEDNAVTAQLQEITALENALLQANADAMRLAGRIVQQLTATKKEHTADANVAKGISTLSL
eukprot:gene14811-16983_t